jgi:hypothetical protein
MWQRHYRNSSRDPRQPAVNSRGVVTRDSESSKSVHSGSERERPVYVWTPSDLVRNRDNGPGTALVANLYTGTGNRKTPGGASPGVSR